MMALCKVTHECLLVSVMKPGTEMKILFHSSVTGKLFVSWTVLPPGAVLVVQQRAQGSGSLN